MKKEEEKIGVCLTRLLLKRRRRKRRRKREERRKSIRRGDVSLPLKATQSCSIKKRELSRRAPTGTHIHTDTRTRTHPCIKKKELRHTYTQTHTQTHNTNTNTHSSPSLSFSTVIGCVATRDSECVRLSRVVFVAFCMSFWELVREKERVCACVTLAGGLRCILHAVLGVGV